MNPGYQKSMKKLIKLSSIYGNFIVVDSESNEPNHSELPSGSYQNLGSVRDLSYSALSSIVEVAPSSVLRVVSYIDYMNPGESFMMPMHSFESLLLTKGFYMKNPCIHPDEYTLVPASIEWYNETLEKHVLHKDVTLKNPILYKEL